MNALKTFFRSVIKSSTDPKYYRDVVAAPFSFSLKYFFLFNLLAAIVTGLSILIPLAMFDAAGAIRSASAVYPEELRVTAGPEGLSINQPLPYRIPIPEREVSQVTDEPAVPSNLVVFADNEAISGLDDVRAQDALVVLTQNEIYVLEDLDTGEIRALEMPAFEERWTIDRSVVNNVIETIASNPFVQQKLYVPLLAGLMLMFLYPAILIMRALTLLIFAFIVWVITLMFMKAKNLSFAKIFQISIHSITPVVLIAYALGILGYLFFHGPLYFLVFMAWTLFVISRLPDRQPATVTQASSAPAKKAAPAAKKPAKSTSSKRKAVKRK